MKFNRDFLNAYLQDLMLLYFSEKKVKAELEKREEALCRKQYERIATPNISKPQLNIDEGTVLSIRYIVFGVIGMAIALCSLGVLLIASEGFVWKVGSVAVLIVSVLIALWSYLKSSEESKKNSEIMRKNELAYAQAKEEYDRRIQAAQEEVEKKRQRGIDNLNEQIAFYQKELDKVQRMRERLLDVNIIPLQYRSLYPVTYLYDWFRTSQLDNIELALQMYVLEEIKSRLDSIIENQAQMLLNQRIMIANQYAMEAQQQEHNRMLMKKLDELNATNEERNVYLKMIGANTAADAYFSTADFLRR